MHLGCARNLIDSEGILARLAEEGCVIAGDLAQADVAVLNTCSFIGPAREESEQSLQDLLARKRRGELAAVVVAGCLVQRYRNALAARFPEVDLFAEISDYRELARAVANLERGAAGPRYLAAGGLRAPEREGPRLLATPASYAYLRISHGCDHTCSFCAIPAIRGPHRSKPLAALRDEARELIDAGRKELVLVAEDSTAWGLDLGLDLPRLVEELAELEGDHRLRIMYAYPNRFPWGLLPLLREHPRVLPYLDIPVQHVSTRILQAMRRGGTGASVRRTLDRLREGVPGIALRTTLLVGFPGETDEDAAALAAFVSEYELARMGAFLYSPEEGTGALALGGEVPVAVAEERLAALFAARDAALAAAQSALRGEEVEVLVDERNGDGVRGRTPWDAPEVDLEVELPGVAAAPGDRLRAIVTGVGPEFDLIGELAGPPDPSWSGPSEGRR
ncbi:MAG: 30S ribosomal protein S12 methylthiotransferase RimO [Planctomycetota bacterium]